MTFEQTVLEFREYANQVLKEQAECLKESNIDPILIGKLARLKVFNTHLEILKQKLSEKTEYLLSQNVNPNHHNKLRQQLHSVSVDYIHEYLSLNFDKEE